MPATFTVKQVADILGYSTNSIYSFLKAKRIKGVRVGKGRFRIPQSELDRLLLGKGGTPSVVSLPKSPVVVSQAPYVASAPMGDVQTVTRSTDEFIDPIAANRNVEVPRLFDWFVGVGSIIVGLSMFLFSKSYEEFAVSSSVSWILMMRSVFIAGGFGLILTDMSGKKSAVWSSIFRFVLVIVYVLYSVLSMYGGSTDVGILFGLIVPLLVLSFRRAFLGIHLFTLYSIAASVSMVLMMGMQRAGFNQSVRIGGSEIGADALFGLMGLVVVVLSYIGYTRSLSLLRMGIVFQCIVLVVSSFQYAQQMMWGRSLFLLMMALFTSFIPVWKTLTFTQKRDRSFVFGVIGALLLLFVFVVGCIHIMQTNMISVTARELDNKVVYGKVSVESALESAKSSLLTLAANPLLIEAMDSDTESSRIDLSKTVVSSGTSLRHVALFSPTGDILSSYPLAQSPQSSVTDEDYFKRVISTKQMVVTGMFEPRSGDTKQNVVLIAVPVLGTNGTLHGIVAGILDMDAIGLRLQQLSSEATGEYALLVDKSARYIIHPDTTRIGTLSADEDPIRLGLSGERGITEGFTVDGKSTLTAVDSVSGSDGWALAMRVPRASVLLMHDLPTVVVTFLLMVSTAIISIFFISHRKKTNLVGGDTYGVPIGGSS